MLACYDGSEGSRAALAVGGAMIAPGQLVVLTVWETIELRLTRMAAFGNIPIAGSTAPPALLRGYAVVSTDSGHRGNPATPGGPNADGSFAADQQARLDFFYQSVGDVTREARALVLARIDRLDPEGFAQTQIGRIEPGPAWPGNRLHTLNAGGGIECIDGAGRAPRYRALVGVESLGAVGLVAAAVGSGWWRRMLERRVPQFLGRISFSLYLVHVPVLLALAFG